VILFRRPVVSSFRAEQVPSEATDPSRRSFLKIGCACFIALTEAAVKGVVRNGSCA
jgi:hypothetical protein